MQVILSSKVIANTFSYYKDGSNRPVAHQDPYVFDLNGDGVDEVIFGGLETQPNTPKEFSPLTVHIFGWKSGVFQDLSAQWLPNGAGDISGVGAFEFADFNGDGLTDIFLAAYADMEYTFSPYVLINKGGFFEKKALPVIEAWQHGSSTFDINSDGYADVFATGYGNAPTIYLGGSEGLTPCPFTNGGWPGGSDVAVGDFLGDGTISAITVDSYAVSNDTMLLKIHLSNGSKSAYLEEIRPLVTPLLENQNTNNEESHDVRVLAVDFNADGYLDVVIYSRSWFDGTKWPNTSAVQLLQNMGKGVFVDVTTTNLKGYASESMIPYAPLARDINKDGLLDLYLDGSSWDVSHNSASLLLQESSGKFVDTGRVLLSSQVPNDGGISTLALGPDGNFHLVTLEIKNGQGIVSSQTIEFPDRESSESLIGTKLSDHIWGMGGNDILQGLGGNDFLDGGTGTDSVLVNNSISNCSVTKTVTGYTLFDKTGLDGTDTLLNIEAIKFSDKTINLTVQAKAASAPQADVTRLVELYTAFFNRVPDADGMSFWIDEMKSGQSINQIAESFYNAGVNYSSLTGFSNVMSNSDFINVIYKNVLGRTDGADAGGLSFWLSELTSLKATRGTLVTNILDSAHTFKNNATWGWVADLLDNKITVAKKFSIDMGLNYNTPEESITKGMAIASAITPTDTSAAVTLIGVTEANLLLV